ncbi:YihY/virulence factor BrkB family protein [Deinococcus psychrotolerans]|uniref:YihY/virulence factor BrkB family protein n=1 Tax=Deinococcus psychrotolerans TaxID=2489213 RepID=A0A3G8Y9V4_9DEIO|nr:YihY/virulence factor BrkB family protein [Deinococcus psychrotolerans]AZI42132.1 YihY/virulence factor BrkB family protein [Deinococcus psychrotolerans]
MNPKLKTLFELLKDAVSAFNQDNAPRLAAALAYYAISSVGPILFLIVTVAGIVFQGQDRAAITQQLTDVVQNALGSSGDPETSKNISQFVGSFVKNISDQFDNPSANTLAIFTGLATLFLTSTGLFLQLQGALNALWDVKPAPGILGMIRTRLIGFLMVLVFGALVVVFIAGNTYLTALTKQIGDTVGQGANFARLGTGLLAMVFFTPVFAATFKWLPAVNLKWRQVWTGGAITAVLFVLSQAAIGVYFARATPGSVYGAASTLFVVLLWIYFSSMVIFFGAEVTWVYSQRPGEKEQLAGVQGRASTAKAAALGLHERRPIHPPHHAPRPPLPLRPPPLGRAAGSAALSVLALPSVLVLGLLRLTGLLGSGREPVRTLSTRQKARAQQVWNQNGLEKNPPAADEPTSSGR